MIHASKTQLQQTCSLTTLFNMFYTCKADYFCLTCQASFSSLCSSYTHGMLLIITPHHPPHPLGGSCPLSGFRLMTSDSPLREASCLQSAVRLLVIIFQSVTLVSALWLWERGAKARAGGMGEVETGGGEGKGCDVWWWAALCVCV